MRERLKRTIAYCNRHRAIGGVALGILVMWFAWFVFACCKADPSVGTTIGVFGDSFGAINALFSGLASAGVIWAILLQRQELQIQRQELILQREEMQLTRAELEKSASAHEETVNLTRADHEERRLQTQRASTLILERSGRTDGTPGRVSFKMKNLGTVALDVHIPESVNPPQTTYSFYTECKEILTGGSELTIWCRMPYGNPKSPVKHPDLEFELNYIDVTGRNRRQKYLCDFNIYDVPVKCVDAGIP